MVERDASRPRNPNDIMNDAGGALARVFRQTRELLAIQDVVRQFVPPNVKVASIQDKTLHLVTPSSAAATQIRYRQRAIIASIRQSGTELDVTGIRVSVRPEAKPKEPPTSSPRPPSEENARQLASTAEYIEDEALRKALMRLSNRS